MLGNIIQTGRENNSVQRLGGANELDILGGQEHIKRHRSGEVLQSIGCRIFGAIQKIHI